MARLPEEFISRLKAANNIVDVFRLYADVKKRGRIYICCCPFHAEKTPSCTIYPDDDPHFYCFGCHENGDVISLVMKAENLPYMEAVQTLASRCGMTVPALDSHKQKNTVSRDKCYEINRETANFYYWNLLHGNDKNGLRFLSAHQIQPQTVKKFGLGFASDDGHLLRDHLTQKGFSEQELLFSGVCRQNYSIYDTFRNRLLFPVLDMRGNVTGFSGMEIYYQSPVWLNVPDQNKNIFCLHLTEKSDSENFILAEDPLNAILLWQAGLKNVISVPSERITPNFVKRILSYTSEMILISSDLQVISPQILNLFSEANISSRVLQITNAHSSGELLRNIGADAFHELIQHAGDARRTALQNAVAGLDPQTDQKTMIQRIVQELSGIRDPLEREIYMSDIAGKTGIPLEALQSHVAKKRKGNSSVSKSYTLTSSDMQKPVINKQPYREQILIYLMRHPQACADASLSQKHFDLPADYQLYHAICTSTPFTQEIQDRAEQLRQIYQTTEILYPDFLNAVSILTR